MIKYTYNDRESRMAYVEPGDYIATITEFTFGVTGKGHDKIDFQLDIGDALIYDTVVFTEAAAWKFDTLLKCFVPNKEGGVIPSKGSNVEINEEYMRKNLVGAQGWLTTFVDEYEGKKKSKVQGYISAAKKPLSQEPVQESVKAEEAPKADVEEEVPF